MTEYRHDQHYDEPYEQRYVADGHDHGGGHEDGHGHGHSHDGHIRVSRHATRITLAIVIPLALLTLVGMIWLWPGKVVKPPADNQTTWHADVLAVKQVTCPPPEQGEPAEPNMICGTATIRLNDGPDAGQEVVVQLPTGPGAPVISVQDKVTVAQTESSDQPGVMQYDITDHDRGTSLWTLLAIFAIAAIGFGRWKGLAALVGLAVTFVILLFFVVPAILQGESPLLVAIVGASATMLIVLYLTNGFNTPTSMAVLGTLASLALTGAMAWGSTSALKLTGVTGEETFFLSTQFGNVNMLGLLLAGIIIGALGVLAEVTITQAYTVAEVAAANPRMSFARLYRAGDRVGRAHIASVINTIVLAYAGASLPLLLLLSAGSTRSDWPELIKGEQLTEEIVRSVVGTLGLIAAVPITTALAALAVQGKRAHGRSAARAPQRPQQRPPQRHRVDPLENAWGVDDDRPAWPR